MRVVSSSPGKKRIAIAAILCVWLASGLSRAEDIKILFLYGSEKESWVKEATKDFNASPEAILPNGDRIVVEAKAAGSNAIITDVIEGKVQAHIISPASSIFLEIAKGITVERKEPPVVNQTVELVKSPLVIAVWREIAEAMGWPNKPLRWRDVFKYVSDEKAWSEIRPRAALGSFKYGHTHPRYSNSGILALIAEVYSGLDQFDPQKVERELGKIKSPELRKYMGEIEGRVLHYGESTGFFSKKMFDPELGGSQFLSAAILYENLVFEENKKARDANPNAFQKPEVVAIYPADGTFANEHPTGIVERPWVSPKQRAAAETYIKILRSNRWQKRAMELGFRPAVAGFDIENFLTQDLGVDASQFSEVNKLVPPPDGVIRLCLELWKETKRPADIVLAIDTSGSMKTIVTHVDPKTKKELKTTKLKLAEEAALEFVKELDSADRLQVLLFDTAVLSVGEPILMDEAGKVEYGRQLKGLPAGGSTALYEAATKGFTLLDNRPTDRNRGLVILSDGRSSVISAGDGDVAQLGREKILEQKKQKLLKLIQNDGERNIFIHTIGYGDPKNIEDLDVETLKAISKATQGIYSPADPNSIHDTLRKIVTFF